MADETALADQAWAAAKDITSRYLEGDDHPPEIVALVAAGWLEGRQAGGDEAQAIIRAHMERLR